MNRLLNKAPVSYYVYPGLKLETLSAKQRADLRKKKTKPDHLVIMDCVSEYFTIPIEWIKSKVRKRKIVWARQVYMFLCLNNTGMTLKEIGESVDCDHTTVIHSREHVKDMVETDPEAAEELRDLESKIRPYFPRQVVGDRCF